MIHRVWNKNGKHQDIQHFDLDAWITDGWLTSEPTRDEPTVAIKPSVAKKPRNEN